MQILARSHKHRIHTVTAGRDDLFWVRRPTNLLQIKEGERERRKPGERRNSEGERGRERSNQYALKLTCKIHRSLPTPNWDSVIVSSVRCTLKRREEIQESILHPLLTTSYFGNYGLRPKIDSPLWRDLCQAIGGWMGGEGRVGVLVERDKKYRVCGADAPLGGHVHSVSAAEWGKEGWLCLLKRHSLHSICPQSFDGL